MSAQETEQIIDQGKGIAFADYTLENALTEAKKQNKLIFIDCYTAWCSPCKKMLNTVFKDTRVGDLMNDKFICLKINIEQDADGIKIMEKYKIKVYPTYLILNQDALDVKRFTGADTVKGFTDKIQAFLESEKLLTAK